jgi:hypothetical protein
MNFTRNVFEINDNTDQLLINTIIELSIQKKVALNKADEKKKGKNVEYGYDDFLLNMFKILRFYTRLNMSLELSADKKVHVKLFAKNKFYNLLAQSFYYDLQLKPYAIKYNEFKEFYEKKDKKKEELGLSAINEEADDEENENEQFIAIYYSKPTPQFHELDYNQSINHPPYNSYALDKNLKFRRYLKNDKFHDCPHDPEISDEAFDKYALVDEEGYYDEEYEVDPDKSARLTCEENCSKFRNIDKLRLLNEAVERTIKFHLLKDMNEHYIFKKNHQEYKEEFSISALVKTANIFNSQTQKKFVHTIRNFFGERIAFYFLFLIKFNLWLIFPSVVGIIIFIIKLFETKDEDGHIKASGDMELDFYDISLFIFCFLITVWATLFLKVWKQYEIMYTYLWGMENIQVNEPPQESFHNESSYELIFSHKIPTYPRWKRNLKIAVSYTIVLIMILLTYFISVSLLYLKAKKTNNGTDEDPKWPIIIGVVNAVSIRIMTIIYDILARKLTIWENHEKKSQSLNANAIKFIMFEFVNQYSALFYIAFLKPYFNEPCVDDCFKEIEIQIYVTLLIHISFNMVGIFIPKILFKYNERNLKKKIMKRKNSLLSNHKEDNNFNVKEDSEVIGDFEPQSVEHQIICEEVDSLISEYNELIILFGYVCFFASAAPLTPALILVVAYVEKYTDIYKFYHLSRVSIIEGSTGIEIYNTIFKSFYFIGMLTNIALVLFTNPHFQIPENPDQDPIYIMVKKIVIFVLLENIILFIMRFMNYRVLPSCNFIFNFRV